jgi:hypothetical protein
MKIPNPSRVRQNKSVVAVLECRRVAQYGQPIVTTEVNASQLEGALTTPLAAVVINPHVMPEGEQVQISLQITAILKALARLQKGFEQAVDRFNQTAGPTSGVKNLTELLV